MFEKVGNGLEQLGEHQSKWMQSGSTSRSGCNRGAAVEVDAIGEQFKQKQSGQQLKLCTESCPAPDYSHR